jgi:hypothetical protein
MTLLELVNRLIAECGVAGGALATLVSPTDESARLTNWIIQSDLEIQELHHDWNFLRAEVEFDTVAGDWSYAPVTEITAITKFSEWKTDDLRVYLKSAGYGSETHLGEAMAYDAFRSYWRFNMRRSTQSRPVAWSIAPDYSLVLGPVPNDVYTVVAEYFKEPTVMASDGDTTVIPARFQMSIVYRAMMKYGAYETASEVYNAGQDEYKRMLAAMELNQLPRMQLPGSLA